MGNFSCKKGVAQVFPAKLLEKVFVPDLLLNELRAADFVRLVVNVKGVALCNVIEDDLPAARNRQAERSAAEF